MRRRLWIILPTLVAGVTLGIGSAGAIAFGQHDGNRHPWVGLVVFFDAQGAPIQRCSGSLLSPTVFLTAGHCTGPVEETGAPAPSLARIWFTDGPLEFDPSYHGGSCDQGGPYSGYPCASQDATGLPVPHPNWNGELTIPQTSDVGVVQITSASGLPASYGTLAPLGTLDSPPSKHGNDVPTLTIVGFGAQAVKPALVSVLERLLGTVDLMDKKHTLTGAWNVQFSGHPGKNQGKGNGKNDSASACFGDSGGPVLAQSSGKEVIVGVISFLLTDDCTGPAVAYRVDTAYAQSFIGGQAPAQ
jgi:Trypsin